MLNRLAIDPNVFCKSREFLALVQVCFRPLLFILFSRESDGKVGGKRPDGEIFMFREEHHVDA